MLIINKRLGKKRLEKTSSFTGGAVFIIMILIVLWTKGDENIAFPHPRI
jgi:hypothetical protein